MTKDSGRGCAVRLVVATALVIALVLTLPRLAMWSSYEWEYRMAFVYAALGAGTMVCAVPVLWRGMALQRVAAIVLLILACPALWPAVDFILSR
ncbi:MAG: hypothetical protein NT154_35810 [Verrucomicrobia bacterium]|nr:hypothetical protein [Verrucomicrobiota bacterium]